jgi:hypothetical protein
MFWIILFLLLLLDNSIKGNTFAQVLLGVSIIIVIWFLIHVYTEDSRSEKKEKLREVSAIQDKELIDQIIEAKVKAWENRQLKQIDTDVRNERLRVLNILTQFEILKDVTMMYKNYNRKIGYTLSRHVAKDKAPDISNPWITKVKGDTYFDTDFKKPMSYRDLEREFVRKCEMAEYQRKYGTA